MYIFLYQRLFQMKFITPALRCRIVTADRPSFYKLGTPFFIWFSGTICSFLNSQRVTRTAHRNNQWELRMAAGAKDHRCTAAGGRLCSAQRRRRRQGQRSAEFTAGYKRKLEPKITARFDATNCPGLTDWLEGYHNKHGHGHYKSTSVDSTEK